MATRLALYSVLALSVVLASGCSFGDSTSTPATSDPTAPPVGQESNGHYVSGPYGSSSYPLSGFTDQEVNATLVTTNEYVNTWRKNGVDALVNGLGANQPAGSVNESTVGTAPQISLFVTGGSKVVANDKDYAKYFACPIEAPDVATSSSCNAIALSSRNQVQSSLDSQAASIQQQASEQNPGLPPDAIEFIVAWAKAALQHGASVAATQAAALMRAEGKCDQNLGKWAVANLVGYEQGINLVLKGLDNGQQSPAEWARAQVVKACVAETDHVAIQAGVMAKGLVEQFVKDKPLCAGYDYAKDNVNLVKAETERLAGITAGIQAEVERLKSELFNLVGSSGCQSSGSGGGGSASLCLCFARYSGKGPTYCFTQGDLEAAGFKNTASIHGYHLKEMADKGVAQCEASGQAPKPVASPLVIDLDGDGLKMADHQVSFDLLSDGNPTKMSWVGPREALLALDMNGNGTVDSGTELFGDRTSCGTARCYDGREALAQYDSPARGGNGDGLIDRRDQVYSKLTLWTDRNSDGVSQPDELLSLASAGVLALNLQASYQPERLAGASISLQMQVLTKDGFEDMYDVWFSMRIATKNLAAMMPNR